MIRERTGMAVVGIAWGLATAAAAAPGDVLFSDNFDGGTSAANYTSVNYDADGDTFDPNFFYSGLGTGADVRTGIGAFFETDDAVTAYITGVNVSAPVSITFDMYLNWGSGGSTEYLVAGVYHSGTKSLATAGALTRDVDGVFTAAASDGDFNGSGDYIIRQGPGAGTNLYSGDAAGANGEPFPAIFPSLGGSTIAGTPGYRWTAVELLVDGDELTWLLDGTEVTTVTYTGGPLSGLISIGFADPFPSINNGTTWGVVDNIVVTEVPEPATAAIAGVAGLAALLRRRR